MEKFNYQGKRQDQYESNMKSMAAGCAGMLVIVVSLIIYGIIS